MTSRRATVAMRLFPASTVGSRVATMNPREKMTSGFGLRAIDDHMDAEIARSKQATIASGLTGELTPSGSECGDEHEANAEGELTRTLSALQRLSVEEQGILRRKLGQQQQGSREPDMDKSKTEDEVEAVTADSPYRIVLQKAVVEGDLEAATAALHSGADPNERDDLRHSSLHFAAAKGDIGCLKELMNSGARANVANNVGWSPLHYAVLGGHVEVVEALLRAGAYPCFRDNHLISPLHLASTQAGDRETFQRIAELLGPSALLARDELEQTPLHVASSCGNRGAVSVLLALDADPESTDRKGRSPGQSFLRQVSKRARADIRAALAASVARRNARDQVACGGDDDASVAVSPAAVTGGAGAGTGGDEQLAQPVVAKVNMRRRTVSSVSEEPSFVRRPSLPSVLNLLPAWGGGTRGNGAGNNDKGGETSFGGPRGLLPAPIM